MKGNPLAIKAPPKDEAKAQDLRDEVVDSS